MRYKRSLRILSALLAAVLLTGCAGTAPQQPVQDTTPETQAAETQATVAEAPRHMVDWSADAVVYEVNIRQYTQEGTFEAFSQHLQTLKDMGVNTLWLMPIHPISETKRVGTLGSYYSITDYREVNPEFGTKEDFRKLVDQAHEMGFYIMLDWVANHTGWDCAWIQDHPDWYTKDENGNITDPPGMGWKDVADLNFDNPEMRKEMIACMKYWVEEFDIDGFRCDHASGVPVDFWEEARRELETVKPLLMLAEDNAVISLLEYAFDFNYNWNLYDTLVAVAQGRKNASTIKYYIPDNYPDGTYTLNFLDNHDKNSYEYTILGGFGADALPAMFTLLYTIPGTPLIYSGDEIGLDHNIAFMDRDPIDWESSDISYRPLLTELAEIRSENPALHSGNFGGQIHYYDISRSIFAFYREKDGNVIKCLINMGKHPLTVDVTGMFDETEQVLVHGQGTAVLDTEDFPITEAALEGEVTIQPWEFWITSGGKTE